MRRPLLALAALFLLGCLSGDGQGGRLEALILLGLAAALLVLAVAAREGGPALAALGSAAVALGAAAAVVEGVELEARELRALAAGVGRGTPVRLIGTVRGDSVEQGGRQGVRLEVAAVERDGRVARAAGRARIEVGGERPKPRLLDGERVAVWATLRLPERAEALQLGVDALGTCKSVRLVERLGTAGGAARRAAAQVREAARRAFARSMLPGTERGLVQAMVLGDRSEIDDETAEAFRASGTYHVLALSGAQVALVAALVVWVLRRLGAGPWLQAALTTGAIAFYALLVGGDLPVVRASFMAGAVLLGKAMDVDTDSTNLLGLTGLALLVHRPSSALDVGFQLSFGATLAILVLAPGLTRGVPHLPLRVDLALAASVAAQGALSPLLSARFHRLAPAALVLNIAAVPLSAAVLLAGLLVLLVSPLGGPLPQLAGDAAWIAAHALRVSGDLGPLAPWLDRPVASPSLAALALYACGLALLHRGRRRGGLALLLALQVALLAGRLEGTADGRLHLTLVDVGQGDSLLLRSPSGRAILVDAGGSRTRYDPGERRVAPLLWRLGVHRLDALVVTHAHPDHVGGAPFLLRAFRVEALWEGPAPLHDPAWREVDARLDGLAGRRVAVAEGMWLSWDGVLVRVLGPRPPQRAPLRVRNEDSVVLDVSLGEIHLLLTGDVTGEAERTLAVPRATVVKVPHHGSRSSGGPSFVALAAPRLALVSAGAHNPFGHPHPEVLERYRRAGALVLRTDRDGSVEVATDGRRVWVRTEGEAQERRIR